MGVSKINPSNTNQSPSRLFKSLLLAVITIFDGLKSFVLLAIDFNSQFQFGPRTTLSPTQQFCGFPTQS